MFHFAPRLAVRCLTLCLACALLSPRTLADVKLPAIFADNMVLQQAMPIPVWGAADDGERVTVTISGQSASAEADAQGKWAVKLPALKPGGPFELTVTGKNTLTIKNVLVGEVWLASGQSNMEMNVASCLNAKDEIADSANYPQVRMFTAAKALADTPQSDLKGRWSIARPEETGRFSAVGYFFARHVHQSLKVPVGIVHSSWGGTAAEGWTPRWAMESTPSLSILVRQYDKDLAAYPRAVEMYPQKLGSWQATTQQAAAEGRPLPAKPQAPQSPAANPSHPAGLYNAMIAPLVPYAMRGVIWYQGEGNAGAGERAAQYRTLFPVMIQSWRKQWNQGDFPFLFVQLANYMPRQDKPADSGWAQLREAQLMTLSACPNTGMAVAIDIGDANDIHPKNKQDVGRRLALWALANTYNRKLEHSGPLYDSMSIEGDKVRLKFTHTAGELIACAQVPVSTLGIAVSDVRPAAAIDIPPLVPASKVTGFAIAGADKKFVWADAKIEGDTVVVWSDSIPSPTAVRYAWADNPECNLYNAAGLPASPFRTDAPPRPAIGNSAAPQP